jgi:hypothetical protein
MQQQLEGREDLHDQLLNNGTMRLKESLQRTVRPSNQGAHEDKAHNAMDKDTRK